MELSKEKMLEITERKEKCIKCEDLNCVKCDNFVCANKAWGEEIAFYEKVKKLLQADADGRLLVLPRKVGDTVYEIIEESVPEHYFYIKSYKVQDVSAKAVKYAGDWVSFGYKYLYFTKEEAEAALERMGG
ncbi:MAG: hypothetical protein MR278_01720 [Bacteroidales bacterium]|nr:hypothetical protein [Anaerotignum sp.]MCI5678693.1 hypothetical protein [Bacteroidales bacterium]MDY3925948.1 hypothetical protein [Anaerotignum sp.]